MPDLDAEKVESSQLKNNRPVKDVNKLTFLKQRQTTREQPSENNLQKIKAEDTEHMKLYKEFFKVIVYFGYALGYRFTYDWVPRRQAVYFFHAVCLISVWFTMIYTVHFHFTNGSYKRILEPLSLLGMTISCTLNKFNFTKCSKRIVALMFFTRSLCRQNVVGIRADIIKQGLRRTLTFMKTYMISVLTCLTCYFITPAYGYIVNNEIMSLIPVEIVFCDKSQLSGYIMANLVQAIMGSYACVATILYGLIFILCVCNYAFQVDLIAQDFKDLDAMWRSGSNVSLAYKHAYLRNICKKRQDMNSYLREVKDTHETKLFHFFCANYLSQIICLFSTTKHHWIGGYTLLATLFIEMLFYCLLGTRISIADDRLCFIINDSYWYTYDLQSQRTVMLLLNECQRCKAIKLGPLGPLNVVTGIEIVKSIYSYYTLLTEVL